MTFYLGHSLLLVSVSYPHSAGESGNLCESPQSVSLSPPLYKYIYMSCSVVVWLRKCPNGGTHPLTIDLPAEAVFGLWAFREIFVSNKGKTEGILEKKQL